MKPRDIVSENDLVPREWVDGEEMSVAAWGMREWGSGKRTGFQNGVKFAVKLLTEAAAEKFLADKDVEAKLLKEIARQITNKSSMMADGGVG